MYGENLLLRLIPLWILAAVVSIAVMLLLRRFRGGRGLRTATVVIWSLAAAGYGGTILADRTGISALPVTIIISDSWSEVERIEIIAAADYWNGLVLEMTGRPAFILRRGAAGYQPDRFYLAPVFGSKPCDGLNVVAPDDSDPASSGEGVDGIGRFIACGWHWPGGDVIVWRRQVWFGDELDHCDLNRIVRHELGHMLGLSHYGEEGRSTMASVVRCGTDEAALRRYDRVLLEQLFYGR
ncbi:MAG: matrixin family metalloprotease [Patescibacteria group bacterium]|jgi:hypothetical protein